MLIEPVKVDGYEQVVHFSEAEFSAYIAVHSTVLGPALGGCRITHYDSDAAALTDALRLSKGMTYKNALADIPFGGGKCVVRLPKGSTITPDMLRLVGQAVHRFNGTYITAEDVGTTLDHMKIIEQETCHVIAGDGGDPSPTTARGVFNCIEAATDFEPCSIYVQGLGKVGWALCKLLFEHGWDIAVKDIVPERVQAAVEAFEAIPYEDHMARGIDVYAPCAMGSVVNSTNIETITFPIICGSANNQLETDALADRLEARGIGYCPDFLVNAGGVIAAAGLITGKKPAEIDLQVDKLGDLLGQIIDMSEIGHITPLRMAKALALTKIM